MPHASTNYHEPNPYRLVFFACPLRWRGFRAWPRERHPGQPRVSAPADASLLSIFSGGLASVVEATSFADVDLATSGCDRQLLWRGRRGEPSNRHSYRDSLSGSAKRDRSWRERSSGRFDSGSLKPCLDNTLANGAHVESVCA